MSEPERVQAFFRRFLETPGCPADARERFYESFRIGSEDDTADEGARLIVTGKKTATSALLQEYEDRGKPPPEVGALSVVLDGRGRPVCVVATTWVQVIPFREVDAAFASDYGEADGTLEGWRRLCRAYYSDACEAAGRNMTDDTPLVCERFRVVYP